MDKKLRSDIDNKIYTLKNANNDIYSLLLMGIIFSVLTFVCFWEMITFETLKSGINHYIIIILFFLALSCMTLFIFGTGLYWQIRTEIIYNKSINCPYIKDSGFCCTDEVTECNGKDFKNCESYLDEIKRGN